MKWTDRSSLLINWNIYKRTVRSVSILFSLNASSQKYAWAKIKKTYTWLMAYTQIIKIFCTHCFTIRRILDYKSIYFRNCYGWIIICSLFIYILIHSFRLYGHSFISVSFFVIISVHRGVGLKLLKPFFKTTLSPLI